MDDDTQPTAPWLGPAPEASQYAAWLASNLDKLCKNLGHEPPPLYAGAPGEYATWLQEKITYLLEHSGNRGNCGQCGAEIWWLTHKTGAKAPYTPKGVSHFSDCSQAKAVRRWAKQRKSGR